MLCYIVIHAEFPQNEEPTLKEEPLFSGGIKYTPPTYSDNLNCSFMTLLILWCDISGLKNLRRQRPVIKQCLG